MSTRGPVAHAVIGFGLVCAALLALAGSIVLHGGVLLAVVLAAALAACLAYGSRDGGRAAAVVAAWKAAGWTVAIIMVLAGVVVLAGDATASVLSAVAVVGGGAAWVRRVLRAGSAGAHDGGGTPAAGESGAGRLAAGPAHDSDPADLGGSGGTMGTDAA